MRELSTRRFLAGFLLLASLTTIARADTNSLALMNMTGPITGYTGTGIKIGQLESGNPDSNNLAISGNVVFTTNITTGVSWLPTAHATQVAGVMVSTNVNDPGVAPGATVYSAALSNGTTQAYISSAYLLATGSNVRVINESFGSRGASTIGTSVWERAIDALVDETGVIFVQAAGNSGSLGANSVREPGGSYNAIVVGAVNNATPGTATNVAAYSSQGYLSNGRSAPDILAPGGGGTAASNVEMPTYPSGAPPTNTTFGSAGTSFATPHISGLVADLLQATTANVPGVYQGYAQDSRTMKAVLLNSATQLTGWTQTGTVTNGAGLITITHPLDASQGAGLANGGQAYNQYFGGAQEVASYVGGRFGNGTTTNSPVNGLLNPLGWDFRGSSFGLTNFYQDALPSSGPLRITLDWNEDVANDATNTVLRLANLDLLLWSSPNNAFTNLTLVAQSVSTVDNLEQISLNTTGTNYYEFGVQYVGNSIATTAFYQTNQFQFVNYGVAWSFTSVPEPSSLLLAVLGLGLFWRAGRKRRS